MNRYFFITLKRYIEQIIMFPFVLAGNIIAMLKPLKEEYDFFIFFPIYGIGGAEKIYGNVIATLPDQKIIIFFTRESKNDKLLHLFQKPNITIKDISKWTDNKFIYWANLVYRGICAHYINRQKKRPIVFNGQCNFGYKLFPHVRKSITKIELIHTSDPKFARITFPYVPFMNKRIMYVDGIIEEYKEYYRQLGIPAKYGDRILNIQNTVFVTDGYVPKPKDEKLKVYYAGRGGYQKRLELVFEIARFCLNEQLRIEFHFAGTFEDEIPADLKEKIHWHGSISTDEGIYKLHQSMDVLLMTSRFEGFPVVIMEAMACGVAIVATAVNGIPEHISNGKNGFLIDPKLNEKDIVNEGIAYLQKLQADKQLLERISRNNHEYAKKHFSKEVFTRAYRTVFGLSPNIGQ